MEVRPRNIYGFTIGILMLETRFPRFPGDIGNATTFDFPVRHKVVKGASGDRAVKVDLTLLDSFIEAGKELEGEGVRAITTSAGFLSIFQNVMAEALDVPVFTSSLLQIPMIRKILKPNKRIGIIASNKNMLDEKHLSPVGIEDMGALIIEGMENEPVWRKRLEYTPADLASLSTLRTEVEQAVVRICSRMVQTNRDVGAIVFECTNLPPFSKAVQEATGRPVFDIVTLTKLVHNALEPGCYRGYM